MSDLPLENPILLVGIGGAGTKIAKQVSKSVECECLLLSNDRRDLDDRNSIFINSEKWVNPSTHKLRSFAMGKAEQIKSKMEGFATVIVVSSLAGRAGAAIAPIVCNAAKERSTVVSVAIMPFGFEKDRIFNSGVSLRRVRECSHSTIVMDNDAFLDNNPELSKEECYSLTNSAIVEVLSSLSSRGVRPEMNILCTSKATGDSEASLRDSASMLFQQVADTEAIKRTVLYVMGGEKLPISALNQLASYARGIFKEEGATEVAISSAAGEGMRVHLMASAPQKTRFDAYDPLGDIIPRESHIDWDEPDSAPEIQLAIPVIE